MFKNELNYTFLPRRRCCVCLLPPPPPPTTSPRPFAPPRRVWASSALSVIPAWVVGGGRAVGEDEREARTAVGGEGQRGEIKEKKGREKQVGGPVPIGASFSPFPYGPRPRRSYRGLVGASFSPFPYGLRSLRSHRGLVLAVPIGALFLPFPPFL